MGINITGKACFCTGVVMMVIGAIMGFLAWHNTIGAVGGVVSGVDNAIKAINETVGTFTIEKTTVEVNGDVIENDIAVKNSFCVRGVNGLLAGGCPVVTITTNPAGAAVACQTLSTCCSETAAAGNAVAPDMHTICILKQPPIGKYNFSSTGKVMIISDARAQEAGAQVLGHFASAAAFFVGSFICAISGACLLCITFVCYALCGGCQEEEEEDDEEKPRTRNVKIAPRKQPEVLQPLVRMPAVQQQPMVAYQPAPAYLVR